MIVNLSRFMVSWWWLILLVIIGSIVGFIAAYKRSPKMQHSMDRLVLKLPVIGQIMHNSSIARFARTTAVTFKAGVPLVEALASWPAPPAIRFTSMQYCACVMTYRSVTRSTWP